MGQDIGAVRYGGVVVGASSLPEATESLAGMKSVGTNFGSEYYFILTVFKIV
jgi:hypothetical protein